jgi:hypothetical protein
MAMHDAFITLTKATGDLPDGTQVWKGDSYDARREHIVGAIGREPSPNMILIKEGRFSLAKRVEMVDLLRVMKRIKNMYGIDCFQITIDEKKHEVLLLFDWYDYKEGKSHVINRSMQIAMSVLIIRQLKLPKPTGELWDGYFIKSEYQDEPEMFQEMLSAIQHAEIGRKNYRRTRDLIHYVQNKIEGRVK